MQVREAAIGEGFRHMRALYAGCVAKIGDGARDAQHAMIAAGGEAHRVRRFGEELCARRVGRCDPIQNLAFGFRIGADGETLVTPPLDVPCVRDPRRNLIAALGRRRQGQIGSGDARDLDMQIDAVEQRPLQAALIIQRAFGRTPARLCGLT